jgi:class 3 adenylate cyclase/alpha-beta hydrolase superfamily lysophospholipase
VQPPQTQYVDRDGVSIAYQVVGDGPVDLLMSPGHVSHLDLQWTDPGIASFLARLASFSRLIIYDKPGTGLSDPVDHLPTLEERAADIEAVLDAAGSRRAALFGISEGGPTSVMFAAMRPQRIISLVVYGTFAVLPTLAPEDFSAETLEQHALAVDAVTESAAHHGEVGAFVEEIFAPSLTLTAAQKRAFGIFLRAAASPRMVRALVETLMQIDIRGVLPSVSVPTLVLHVDGDRFVPIEAGRHLAEGIPGARLVTLPGIDHAFWLADGLPQEIERFVTGATKRRDPNRVLATVLFTDIVGSTTRAAELGDRAWREVLERHDELLDRVVPEHGGRVIKHMGDGALSAFDGPAIAMRCAAALRDGATELGIELRGGIHTGECEVIGEDLGGLAVHIGARVGAFAGPGEIVVSSTVKELVVGSDLQFTDRGEHALKGVPGMWRLYALGAERTPQPALGAAENHMRRSDRVAVVLARRMPRAMRFAGQLGSRGTPPT